MRPIKYLHIPSTQNLYLHSAVAVVERCVRFYIEVLRVIPNTALFPHRMRAMGAPNCFLIRTSVLLERH